LGQLSLEEKVVISEWCPVPITTPPPYNACANDVQHVPYTFVCDHHDDCQDGSDEAFCVFPACEVFHNATGNENPLYTQCRKMMEVKRQKQKTTTTTTTK
jgi:hypothetical protein